MDDWLKRFVPPEILSRKSYTPGFQPKSEGNLVKLNTNENPLPSQSFGCKCRSKGD